VLKLLKILTFTKEFTAMEWVLRFVNTSIIKKQVMALTGLGLCGFLVVHLLGNFLLLVSAESFNMYAYTLTSNKAILYIAEAGLLALFLTHIGMAFRLTMQNHLARADKYAYREKTGKGSTFASSTMIWTGMIILAFLVYHLMNFKYGTVYWIEYDGLQVRDLSRTVFEHFSNIWQVIIYIVAMISMGVHLSHGFVSAFQSLGISHPKFSAIIDKLGVAYFVSMTAGFSFIPVWCFYKGVN
jgi:succinate dehydrogenase / fumarate reductase, cytochrome b subunit